MLSSREPSSLVPTLASSFVVDAVASGRARSIEEGVRGQSLDSFAISLSSSRTTKSFVVSYQYEQSDSKFTVILDSRASMGGKVALSHRGRAVSDKVYHRFGPSRKGSKV